jgi:hypothetical protein
MWYKQVVIGLDTKFFPVMGQNVTGAVLTIHKYCDRREGEDTDRQRGHIIGSSWVFTLPSDQGLQNIQEFNIIIL